MADFGYRYEEKSSDANRLIVFSHLLFENTFFTKMPFWCAKNDEFGIMKYEFIGSKTA
mgnify:FL=1